MKDKGKAKLNTQFDVLGNDKTKKSCCVNSPLRNHISFMCAVHFNFLCINKCSTILQSVQLPITVLIPL